MVSDKKSAWHAHELTRKSLHILICGVPLLAGVSRALVLGLLALGLVVYSISEVVRIRGLSGKQLLPLRLIGQTVIFTAREGEERGFVLGPVTLALGAAATVLLFPPIPMSAGIYALAFGDTSATLIGRAFGSRKTLDRTREEISDMVPHTRPHTRTKSLAGSLACLCVSGLSIYLVTGRGGVALAGGVSAALCERVTIPDLDNLLIPLGTAATVFLMINLI